MDHQLSEQELFNQSDEEVPVVAPRPRTPYRKRSSVGRFPIVTSPKHNRSRPNSPPDQLQPIMSVLNLSAMPRAENGKLLQRDIPLANGQVKKIDFWNEIENLDSDKMEAVMKLASTDAEYDMTSFIRAIEYQGFDRLYYIKVSLSKMSVSLFCRFALLGALRGSNFDRIKETCEQMPQDMINTFGSVGFVKTPKKRDHITILRCTASIPHWCAFHMKKAGVAKKLDADCPSLIQFPGAASLPMSRTVRMQHIAFCQAFSSLLPGGTFRLSIYMTAMSNSIPVSDIPQSVLTDLGVSSNSESYKLTDDELNTLGGQLVTRK
ncbi:NC [Plasmopara viticola lesion associated mycobunyavirales-like virus 8]|uniref:NC n=1 Tax=Plasmopara viticola lesion associated mycobunyavirales-like virus 8 TaxID=2737680 RepID=A0A7H0RQZ7_9VIRU|nr:NC [Plasmopara viticola lesion associated mycobunyavirales-like virus 8]QNQ74051.1 NC [Plasmopara viticola lesion associated mycobunyavirales-like virus 8]